MRDDLAATRRSYDEGAVRYVEGIGTTIGPATETSHDQACLSRFGVAVRDAAGVRRIGDVGCGPGRAAAFLRDLGAGLDVVGVDLSLELLRAGRRAHPDVPVAQGALASLPVRSSSLGGVVSWYSIIHSPPDGLAAIAVELARVLVPGGFVLVAFQAGEGEALDRAAPTFRHAPDAVTAALRQAGLDVVERTVRPAELEHETAPQAFMRARRRSVGSGTKR